MTVSLTENGKALLLRCMAADENDTASIIFKSIYYGSGTDAGTSVTELTNKVYEAAVESFKRDGNWAVLRASFNNSSITTGFYATELGVMVADPDDTSSLMLFAYGYEDEENTIYIPSSASGTIETTEEVNVYVGTAANVSVEIADSLVFAAAADVQELSAKVEALSTEATTSSAGLMSAEDKSKLDGIEAGATAVTVDTALSNSSTNAVQNKVIYTALSNKAGTDVASSSAAGLMSAEDKTRLDTINTAILNIGYLDGIGDTSSSEGVMLFFSDINDTYLWKTNSYLYDATGMAVQIGVWGSASSPIYRKCGTAEIPSSGLTSAANDTDVSGIMTSNATAILRQDYYCNGAHFGDYKQFYDSCGSLGSSTVYYVIEYIAK